MNIFINEVKLDIPKHCLHNAFMLARNVLSTYSESYKEFASRWTWHHKYSVNNAFNCFAAFQ